MKRLALALLALSAFTGLSFAAVNTPTGVTATGISETSIRITWVDNSDNEDAFFIYRSNQSGNSQPFVKIGEVGANVTEFVDETLTHPITRHYRVVAVKRSEYVPEDQSDFSHGAAGSTVSLPPPNQPPVAVDDTNGGEAPVTLTGNVLTNDGDPDGGTLSVEQPNAAIATDGSYSLDFPAGSAGTHTFPYVLLDGQGGSDQGELVITITDAPPPPNVPPVAVDDTNSGEIDTPIAGNVLLNDSDSDGGTLSVEQPNASIAADGSYNLTFSTPGDQVIPYTVLDGQGGEDDGVLTITVTAPPVNQAPTAVDDANAGLVNDTITGNVLTNDTDPEGDLLSVVQPNPDIASDGSYSYTNATAGVYNIPYTVQDVNGNTDDGVLQITVTEPPVGGGLLAFPGADGAGRFAIGGRGGAQMFVTNLNDSGTGSLRACVEASGPRTCIFRVSGYIDVLTSIQASDPFLTIAGETAPGQGVTLRAGAGMCCDLMIVRTHNVIIRHMRYRGGNPPHHVSSNGRNLMLGDILGNNSVHDVIVDHSSFSWATDQPFDVSPDQTPADVSRLTIQNSLIYEGLRPHSKGPNYRACGISTIGTMLASATIRMPNNTCGIYNPDNIRSGGGITGETEFRNNLVYNGGEAFFDMWDGRGDAYANIVGNVFKRGPSSRVKLNNNVPHNIYPVDAWHFAGRRIPSGTCAQNGNTPNDSTDLPCAPDADELHMYLDDNIAIGFTGISPIEDVLNPDDAHLVSQTPVGDGVFEDGVLGPVMPASQVQAHIVANAGAFPNNRDAADAQIISDMVNGTGSIPQCNTVNTVTTCNPLPYPTLASGTPYPDADADGMDDAWESANGVSEPNADADSDGYTNLEEFLHQLAATR